MKLFIAFMLLMSNVASFSAFSASRDYASVFKKNTQKSTVNDFQTNLTQDVQNLLNLLRKKKVVAALETSQKKTNTKTATLTPDLK